MSDVPEKIAVAPWELELANKATCTLKHVGKTSNYWSLPLECGLTNAALQIHTDRVWVDGQVSPELVRDKGATCCSFAHWWMLNASRIVCTQLIMRDRAVFAWLKSSTPPETYRELLARALVIDEHRVVPVKCVLANDADPTIEDCPNDSEDPPNQFLQGEISGWSSVLYCHMLGIANRRGIELVEAQLRWSPGGTLVGDSLTPDWAAFSFSNEKEGDPEPYSLGYYQPRHLQDLFYQLTSFLYADYQTNRQSWLNS